MARDVVRVWLEGGGEAQHLAAPPKDDVTHVWEAHTLCGEEGKLRWITLENVDGARACAACAATTGYHPPKLEGEHWGPV